MTTLVQKTYDNFVGSTVATLPRLPATITVPGADIRISAESYFKFADGTLLSTWDDVYTGNSVSMTPAKTGISGATRPQLSRTNGQRVGKFDGEHTATGVNYNRAEPYTMCLVAYFPEQLTNAFIATVIGSTTGFKGLGVEGGGLLKWWGAGVVTAGLLTPGWHFIGVVADGLNTRLYLDDTMTAGATAGTPYSRDKLNIGGSVHSTRQTKLDLAELINYPRALSDDEMNLVRASYKTRYDL